MKNVDGDADLSGLRVHAAAIGFGELHRLTEPLRRLRADAFFLLQYPEKDRAAEKYRKGGVNVVETVRSLGLVTCDVWPVNIWDAASVGNLLGRKVVELGLQSLDVNVSTGPKTIGIGATLASHFWPIRLYYADLDYDKKVLSETEGYPLRDIQRIPTFRTHPPKADALTALSVLAGLQRPVPGSALKQLLRERGAIRADKRKRAKPGEFSPQAVHSQYQTIVRPLLEQDLARESFLNGRRVFAITDEGRATLRLLQGDARS